MGASHLEAVADMAQEVEVVCSAQGRGQSQNGEAGCNPDGLH